MWEVTPCSTNNSSSRSSSGSRRRAKGISGIIIARKRKGTPGAANTHAPNGAHSSWIRGSFGGLAGQQADSRPVARSGGRSGGCPGGWPMDPPDRRMERSDEPTERANIITKGPCGRTEKEKRWNGGEHAEATYEHQHYHHRCGQQQQQQPQQQMAFEQIG